MHDNKKRQSLEKYYNKNNKYVLFLFWSQKKSNCQIDLGKRTKSLNYLICLSKLLYQIIINFVFKIPDRKNSKVQKKSILTIYKKGWSFS